MCSSDLRAQEAHEERVEAEVAKARACADADAFLREQSLRAQEDHTMRHRVWTATAGPVSTPPNENPIEVLTRMVQAAKVAGVRVRIVIEPIE